MSDGWNECTLNQLFSIKHGFAFDGKYFATEGDYILLTPGNFHDAGGFKLKTKEKFFTGDFDDQYLLPKDSLIVAMTEQAEGLLGSSAIIPESGRFLHNQRLGLITELAEDRIDSHFLYYLFNTHTIRSQIRATATGTKVRHTSPTRIGEVKVTIPNVQSQRKIASILSAYDDLIENNTRRIAILEEMAQAIYREWFVNFRFPGHENVKLVDSELGQIPEGWEVTTVGNLVKRLKVGKKYNNKTVMPEGHVPVLDQGKSGIIGYHNDEPGLVASEEEPVIVFANHTCYQRIIYYPFSAIQNVLPFTPHPDAHRNLYWLHWATKDVISFNDYKGHWPEFMAKQIMLPDIESCQAFGEMAKDHARRIWNFERRNENLRTTRDLLLPKLVSGKLDVEDLDIDLGLISEELNQQDESKPQEKAHAFTSGAKKSEPKAKESKPQTSPIDEIETETIMIEFRQAARKLGTTNREDLIKAVSKGLGYKRIGSKIQESLKGHLRAAIRRKIIGASGDEVWPETPAMDSYTRDELVDTLKSVMRKNQQYERDDVIRLVANYLGFKRVSKTLQKPVRSAITGAIRRQILNYEGSIIWREN